VNPFRSTSAETGEATLLSTAQGRDLALPEDRRLALAVIRGDEVGRVYPIDRPRMTIGRQGADIVLSDLEVSRIHAAIEVYRDRIVLKDLGSTNGTYVDEKPIKTAYLQDRSEFRVGSTVLMLIVTPVEETTA
jgi:pSer/pThr/pTyr-binding forkhead associated (FHA) protein